MRYRATKKSRSLLINDALWKYLPDDIIGIISHFRLNDVLGRPIKGIYNGKCMEFSWPAYVTTYQNQTTNEEEMFVSDIYNDCIKVVQISSSKVIRTHKETQGFAPHRYSPSGLAIHPLQNHLLVCNNGGIQILDLVTNAVIKHINIIENSLINPICITHHSNMFFISDSHTNSIISLDSHYKHIRSFGRSGTKEFKSPQGLGVSSLSDLLYVSDCKNNRVVVCTQEGELLTTFGNEGTQNGQFKEPSHVLPNVCHSMTDEEEFLVSDVWNHRVQIFQRDGTDNDDGYRYKSQIGRTSTEGSQHNGQFRLPEGMAFAEWNSLLLVCDPLNNRVQYFM